MFPPVRMNISTFTLFQVYVLRRKSRPLINCIPKSETLKTFHVEVAARIQHVKRTQHRRLSNVSLDGHVALRNIWQYWNKEIASTTQQQQGQTEAQSKGCKIAGVTTLPCNH